MQIAGDPLFSQVVRGLITRDRCPVALVDNVVPIGVLGKPYAPRKVHDQLAYKVFVVRVFRAIGHIAQCALGFSERAELKISPTSWRGHECAD